MGEAKEALRESCRRGEALQIGEVTSRMDARCCAISVLFTLSSVIVFTLFLSPPRFDLISRIQWKSESSIPLFLAEKGIMTCSTGGRLHHVGPLFIRSFVVAGGNIYLFFHSVFPKCTLGNHGR